MNDDDDRLAGPRSLTFAILGAAAFWLYLAIVLTAWHNAPDVLPM